RLSAIPLRTRETAGFSITADRLAAEVDERGIGAVGLSNPCHPTGHLVQGDELRRLGAIPRWRRVTLLLDAFYSHFVYDLPAGGGDATPGSGPVSGAEFVDDVDRDPVLLFDGLTKSFRYPGWRIGWVVGPPAMVESIARTASAIDGGPSRWAQRAAIEVLEPSRADQETAALRRAFCEKRNLMV